MDLIPNMSSLAATTPTTVRSVFFWVVPYTNPKRQSEQDNVWIKNNKIYSINRM